VCTDAQQAASTSLQSIAVKVMKHILKKPQHRRKVNTIEGVNAVNSTADNDLKKLSQGHKTVGIQSSGQRAQLPKRTKFQSGPREVATRTVGEQITLVQRI
jgi:hypothetical protein